MKKIINITAGVACLPLLMLVVFIVAFTVGSVLSVVYLLNKLDLETLPETVGGMLNDMLGAISLLLKHIE